MARVRIAIPSEGEGGLDGMRSGHFGHCDVFTFVDLEDGDHQGGVDHPQR